MNPQINQVLDWTPNATLAAMPTVSAEDHRYGMRHFAVGVSIITARDGEQRADIGHGHRHDDPAGRHDHTASCQSAPIDHSRRRVSTPAKRWRRSPLPARSDLDFINNITVAAGSAPAQGGLPC